MIIKRAREGAIGEKEKKNFNILRVVPRYPKSHFRDRDAICLGEILLWTRCLCKMKA